MAHLVGILSGHVVTLPAGGGLVDLIGDTTGTYAGKGFDIRDLDRIAILITNTGANPATSIVTTWLHDDAGSRGATDATITIPGGSLAAGGTLEILKTDLLARRLRMQMGSAAGTTLTVDFEAWNAD